MKLVTFRNKEGQTRTGWLKDDGVVDMNLVSNGQLPTDMLSLIDRHEEYFALIKKSKLEEVSATHALAVVKLLAPLPNPRSFRDYIGFEMHMLNASRSFGHTVGQAWYEMPIYSPALETLRSGSVLGPTSH